MNESSNASAHSASRPPDGGGPVLVAGGTGFIGSAVLRSLAGRRPLHVLTRDAARVRGRLAAGVEVRQGDVTDPASLRAALAGIDTVVQCVQFAGFPVERPSAGRTFLNVDAEGTRAVVRAAVEAGARKIVYLSGVGADIDSPRVWYRAKGIAEAAVRESGLRYAIIRPSWTYGPGDRSLNRFVGLIRAVPLVFPQLGPGTQRINPVHIDDVAQLVRIAVEEDRADGVAIEIGGPDVLTMDAIIRATMRALDREKPIVHIPVALAKVAGALLEAVPGQLLSRGAIDFVTQSAVANLELLSNRVPELRPRGLEAALTEYL